jgi:hypothetical protein
MTQLAIADGYIATFNAYDNQIYCFGKGKTATTVSASPKVAVNGSSVLIEGTITDQSPGAVGTPCVSDKSMSQWMEYLYMQKPQPTNATGVPVQLLAMRSDGSMIDIATVTTDVTGHYSHVWTPPTTDKYTIVANFAGSESYWTSSAETALGVTAAPAPAYITTAAEPAPDNTPIFLGMSVAIAVVAILVVYDIISNRKLRK